MGIYGWADEHRDEDEWALRYAEQTESIIGQLEALQALPRRVWRSRRLLEWVCAGCGETALEVMQLSPYKVVRYRDTGDHPDEAARPAGPPIRVGGYKVRPIADEPGEHEGRTLINPACRCQNRAAMPESLIREDLERVQRKRTLPVSHRE